MTFTDDVDCVTEVKLRFIPTTPPAMMPEKLFGLLIVPDTLTLLTVPSLTPATAPSICVLLPGVMLTFVRLRLRTTPTVSMNGNRPIAS